MVDENYFVQVTYRRPIPVKTAPADSGTHPEPEWPVPSAEAEAISAELTGQQFLPNGNMPPIPDELVPAPAPDPATTPDQNVNPTGKLVPCKGGFLRVLTPEEKELEMAESRESDNPRVRAMFDMIDKNASGQALPEGVRVRQGDLFAPGLVITGNPFPDWFDNALQKKGQFEWDNGCVSYIKMVTGKPEAERWAAWVIEILENERKAALTDGRNPLSDTTEVVVREDHRALLNDILS